MSEKEVLGAFARTAKKKYGRRTVGRADTTPSDDRRILSGSLRLDACLGGGYRVGMITSLYGAKSGGKTTTAKRAVAVSQNLCRNCLRPAENVEAVSPTKAELEEDPDTRWTAKGECTCFKEGLYQPDPPKFTDDKGKPLRVGSKKEKEAHEAWAAKLTKNSYEEYVCAWIDQEHSFDKAWAATIGIDNRRLLYLRPEHAEEAIDMMHALLCTVQCDMMVIDSVAQLVPMKELTASTEEWQQGLQARLVNKAVRKLVSASSVVANSDRTVTQLWINQTREKIGMMFGDPTVKPGGKAQEFAVHSEIKFRKSKQEMVHVQFGNKDEVIDIPSKETFFFTVTKNRTKSTIGVRGHYTQSMRDTDTTKAGSILEVEEVFKMAMYYLVTQDKKSKEYTMAGQKFSSQTALMAALREDKELFSAVKSSLLEQMLKAAA